ncbi:YPR1 putative reductase 1 [Candida maltosa Xu316]|uniref:2-dehydropantolactone reductase n=1 Tax=Candida maltosa (strain Xu316) TaxID=1245528 RepID=M3JC31_CANMX|nr:GCY protein [Candida maltosa Xu316]
MSIPQFTLNDGLKIPALALGTANSTGDEGYHAVLAALKAGYRHIDTASAYNSEEPVGRAIKDSGIPREEIFVTTKLWGDDHKNPEAALAKSLKTLGLDYVDLYLIHWPIPLTEEGKADPSEDLDFVKTWAKFQKLVGKGTKSIGVSNFDIVNLEKLLSAESTTVVPAVNQVELHPSLPQHKLVEFNKSKGIVLEAYSPLGSKNTQLLDNAELKKIADRYGVSVANILISWSIWRGVVVLPKSNKPERVEANFKVVKLKDEDGEEINQLYKKIGKKRYISPNWGATIFHDEEE